MDSNLRVTSKSETQIDDFKAQLSNIINFPKVLMISEYCIWYCSKVLKRPISNLQLNRILYYIQGAYLADTGLPCFEAPILPWRYGPVVKSVYEYYKKFTSDKIDTSTQAPKIDSELDVELINKVCKIKSIKTPNQLIIDTKSERPWIDSYGIDSIISLKTLKLFFSSPKGQQCFYS